MKKTWTATLTMKGKKVSMEMVAITAIAFGAEQIRNGNIKMGLASVGAGLVAIVAYEVLQEQQIAGFTGDDLDDVASTIKEYVGRDGGQQNDGE